MNIDIPATITALGALVSAIGVILLAFWSYRAKERAAVAADKATVAAALAAESQKAIIATKDGIFELGQRVDGRLSELLELTRTSAHAEGMEDQRKKA